MTNRRTRRIHMQKNKPYKYREIEPGEDVVFLLVVKPLLWNYFQSDFKEKDNIKCEHIPVGAITWVYKNAVSLDENGNPFLQPKISIHCENNRHRSNFDPSCFEILLASKQKIKR